MPTWQRTYVAVCAFVTAFALAYVGTDYLHIPRLYYYPHERLWRLLARPDGPFAMGFVGLWLWALLAGAVVAAIAWFAARARQRAISDKWLRLYLAWTVTAVLLAGGYFTWNNLPYP